MSIDWISRKILPFEGQVRAWLRRHSNDDEDDVVQECYFRISHLSKHEHIENSRAYFFRVARNILLERGRRSRVMRLIPLADLSDTAILVDESPNPEREVAARRELEFVRGFIKELSPRCQQVFHLRRMEGLSQRETAQKLGISENIVEKEIIKSLRHVMKRMAQYSGGSSAASADGQLVKRKRHES